MEDVLNYPNNKGTDNNRKTYIIIMGLPLILMALSYALMYLIDNEKLDMVSLLGTKTIGSLVQPVKPLAALHLL